MKTLNKYKGKNDMHQINFLLQMQPFFNVMTYLYNIKCIVFYENDIQYVSYFVFIFFFDIFII